MDKLKIITQRFRRKRFEVLEKDGLVIIEFRPYSNGNIRLLYRGTFNNNQAITQSIFPGTESKVNCANPLSASIQYFDVVYIRDYFLNKLDFPFLIQPMTLDYEIKILPEPARQVQAYDVPMERVRRSQFLLIRCSSGTCGEIHVLLQ